MRVLLLLIVAPVGARAQAVVPGPPGPYVIDLRGTTIGVPQTSDFYPDIPGETVVPARSFGVEAGAHLYPLALGSTRVGLGVDLFWSRGSATTPATSTTTDSADTAPSVALPDVAVRMAIVSPQVSLNFGTSRGWSYLTLGAGRAAVRTTAADASRSTSSIDVNSGGGARWFLGDRLGVGFDLRIHWVAGNTLFAASAGFSLK